MSLTYELGRGCQKSILSAGQQLSKVKCTSTGAGDRLRVGWLNGFSGRGAARAEDAQGTPTQSHTSPSILVYEEKTIRHFLHSGVVERLR